MATNDSKPTSALSLLAAELAPYPGRISGSLRDTLGIVVAVVVAMTLRVPGIALALALLFLMQRERPGLTLRAGMQMLCGSSLACVCSLLWVQVTDGTEVARFLGVVIGIFIAAFCMASTNLPALFTMFGFYGFQDLAAWDLHRSPTATVSFCLFNLASLALVVVSAVGVEYLFGSRHPAEELGIEKQKRIRTLARFFHLLSEECSTGEQAELRSLHNALVQYAHAGDMRMNQLYHRIHDDSSALAAVGLGIRYRMGLLTRVIEKSSLLGFSGLRTRDDCAHYAILAAQCDSLLGDNPQLLSQPLPRSASLRLAEVYAELQKYATSLQSPDFVPMAVAGPMRPLTQKAGLFRPGAFQSAENATYALKLTLAASLCYVIYNAIAWPGILTCVITVLFTGLRSTGAMKQKQFYLFLGTVAGGAIGIATVSLLFPNMDSITSLVVVVSAVSLFTSWVLRSPRMGYVGVQIGFAFFLTTLPQFTAATQLTPARDRLIGMSLGVLVMWVIFDQLWPTRTSDALRQILRRIEKAASELHLIPQQHNRARSAHVVLRLRVAVSQDLANVQVLESTAYFDFGPGHTREIARSRSLIHQIETAAGEFYAEASRLNREDALLTGETALQVAH